MEPLVKLERKPLPAESRRSLHSTSFDRLRTSQAAVCAATSKLRVPVRVVIDHQRLSPPSGSIARCNQVGNTEHDPRLPIFFWYQGTPVGKEVYVVLYTLPCEWGRCSFCTLPSESSPTDVADADLLTQCRFVFDSLSDIELKEARRIFLSNNGSMLNPAIISRDLLRELAHLSLSACPNATLVAFETRLETVTRERIQWIGEELRSSFPNRAIELQFSLGYETQDPYLRNAVLWKGYDEGRFQGLVELCGMLQPGWGPLGLDEYVMLRPAAGMTPEAGIAEAVETLFHLETLGDAYGVGISARLNPTFAAVGSELYFELQANRYRPPTYREVLAAVRASKGAGLRMPLFLGLHDEGLTYAHGTFGNHDATDATFLRALRRYNLHQRLDLLDGEIDADAAPI